MDGLCSLIKDCHGDLVRQLLRDGAQLASQRDDRLVELPYGDGRYPKATIAFDRGSRFEPEGVTGFDLGLSVGCFERAEFGEPSRALGVIVRCYVDVSRCNRVGTVVFA